MPKYRIPTRIIDMQIKKATVYAVAFAFMIEFSSGNFDVKINS